MSAATSASSNLRTYGRKSAMKRKQTKELLDFDETSRTIRTQAKRQKLSPEAGVRTPSPARTEEDVDTGERGTQFNDGAYAVTFGFSRVSDLAPQSPSKPARDFSLIFDDIAPKSPSGSPSKLAKRMLSRSKTESSIESLSNSQPSAIDRTPSLPMFPSTPSRDAENVASTSKAAAPLLPRLTQGSNKSITRTYAGKFRSFLVSLPKSSESNGTFAATADEEGLDTRESYSSLRSRWGVDNSEDDPYPLFSPSPSKSNKSNITTPDMSPSRNGKGKGRAAAARPPPIPSAISLKSISELRNRGESRRFLDEVGYLFEGMNQKGGIGLRRASALEITTKLCDSEFARKAKAADFFTRTWDVFLAAGAGQGEDRILDTLLVFFISLVARDPSSLSELARKSPASRLSSPNPFKDDPEDTDFPSLSFMDILFRLLAAVSPDLDPLVLAASESLAGDLDFKKAGINKKDRSFLTTVYRTIKSRAEIFPPDVPISTSLLISYILQSLPPSLIPLNHFPAFLDSLRVTLSPSPSSSLASALSSKWRDASAALPYDNVNYHLLLLDTYLLNQWAPPPPDEGSQSQSQSYEGAGHKEHNQAELDHARDEWLADDLIALCVCLELCEQSEDLDSTTLQRCLGTVLRVLVSLTHEDELWGRKIVQCEYTMGWMLRLIHRTGQEVLQTRKRVKEEDVEVKVEEGEEGISSDQDGTANGQIDSHALDTLCLTLGLLTNLIQVVEAVKGLVRDIHLDPSCSLQKRACAKKCSCNPALSGIEILVQLYSQQQVKIEEPALSLSADSPEARLEADAAFLRSHLAVLFGLLMKGNPKNEAAVLSALPSPSYTKNLTTSHRSKLSRLVEQAKDFAAFYTAVSRNLGGDKESKVAKDVVNFLEMKRDSIL